MSIEKITLRYYHLLKVLVTFSATERAISGVNNLEAAILKDEMKIRNLPTQVKGIYDVYAYFKQNLVSDIKSISEDLGLSYNTASKAVYLLI